MIFRISLSLIIIVTIFNILIANQDYDINILYPQQNQEGKWGYIDDNGRFRIKPQFEIAMPFKEGLAVVSVCKKYGYIDPHGKPVIRFQFDDARNFCEDAAAVMISQKESSKKWGYIDKTGKFIIKAKYDSASDFFNGTAEVMINNEFFFINKSGEIINVI